MDSTRTSTTSVGSDVPDGGEPEPAHAKVPAAITAHNALPITHGNLTVWIPSIQILNNSNF
jgi:hypothetical protein